MRFGDPDLGVREPLVLEGCPFEVDLGAEVSAHLADGGAEAAGAAVGDRAEEAAVAGLKEDVENHLLGDGVSDLDGASGDLLALAGEFGGAEGGAVDTVSAGSTAERDDAVTRLDGLRIGASGQDADGTAEDEGVGQVLGIGDEGAVDGGDAHAIAVVSHARDHAFKDAAGMEDTGRQ